MRSHVTHAATCCESFPFFASRYFEAFFSMEGVVNAKHGFSVFLDHFSRVEFRVHHDRVHRGMSEKSLDYVYRSVVVEMFGSEDTTAVMRNHDQWRAVRSPQTAFD